MPGACFRDRMRQGCRIRGYKDVFTPCPENKHPAWRREGTITKKRCRICILHP
jgi:hypothetical protein